MDRNVPQGQQQKFWPRASWPRGQGENQEKEVLVVLYFW